MRTGRTPGQVRPAEKTKREDGQCFNVCSIDETSKVGTAVLMQGGASSLISQMGGLAGVFSLASILSIILAF